MRPISKNIVTQRYSQICPEVELEAGLQLHHMEKAGITMDAKNSISMYKISCRCLEHTSVEVNIPEVDCKTDKQRYCHTMILTDMP